MGFFPVFVVRVVYVDIPSFRNIRRDEYERKISSGNRVRAEEFLAYSSSPLRRVANTDAQY